MRKNITRAMENLFTPFFMEKIGRMLGRAIEAQYPDPMPDTMVFDKPWAELEIVDDLKVITKVRGSDMGMHELEVLDLMKNPYYTSFLKRKKYKKIFFNELIKRIRTLKEIQGVNFRSTSKIQFIVA